MDATDSRRRVLVVDDHHQFRRMLGLVLDGQPGIALIGEALDGSEAVELSRELQPDVVLLDIAMPVMDGLEALPLIRAASPKTRVVMLTGFTHGDLRARALAAGACGFLEKGATPTQIIHAVLDAV